MGQNRGHNCFARTWRGQTKKMIAAGGKFMKSF
jgi:hypothetical protein